ncbi:hypothetical protein TNCV_4420451 [Trichonephila clavipes]|nr:hypothetical protein TNCV_4420451 [Trichonephila clavipes]
MFSQIGDCGCGCLEAVSPAEAFSTHAEGCIHIWPHCGERPLAACIRHRQTDPSSGAMLCETIRLTRLAHDRMLLVLYRTSLTRKMFGCCPDQHVHQIFRQWKTSVAWLQSKWLVTIRQSLRMMSYNIVLKLHGHLYLCMPSSN